MIRCPQCGYENAPGHFFCKQCRFHLDIEAFDKKDWNGPQSKPENRRGRSLVGLVLCAGLAAGLALALWPAPLKGCKGAAADARQARQKIVLLEKGLSPAAQVFSEREINAYLNLLLQYARPPQTRRAWTVVPRAAEAAVYPNAVKFSMAAVWGPLTVGSLKLGPWPVTSQLTLVPKRVPRGFRWTIKSGRIGHLPLAGPVSAPAVLIMRPLLDASLRECALFRIVSQLELEEGQVAVALKEPPGGPND